METAHLGMDGLAKWAARASQELISVMPAICSNLKCERAGKVFGLDSEGNWQVGGLADPAIPSPPVP